MVNSLMANPFQTKAFKRLQKQWYSKLIGFDDAEKIVGGEMKLKRLSANMNRKTDEFTREAKLAYFDLIAECVSDETFPCEADEYIMKLHSDGWSKIQISKACRLMGYKNAPA